VVALSARTLGEVLGDVRRVGQVAGAPAAGEALVAELEAVATRLRSVVPSMRRPRICLLEWLDPPMVAGHWSPELLALAGADPVLGHAGEPTRATTFEAIVAVQPEVLLVAPCGYRVAQTLAEMPALASRPGFAELPAVQKGRVLVMDGNAYFNRPGPRLWEGAALLASALYPELVSRPAGASASALVRWG
jgi:iron complex transport system substrate-binding protein